MTLGQNPFNPYRSLPTLAAINRRRTELHAYQARQEAAQAATAADELPAEHQAYLPEESRPFDDAGRTSGAPALVPRCVLRRRFRAIAPTSTQTLRATTARTSRTGSLRYRGSHR